MAKKKSNAGRPLIVTAEIIKKLEAAFAMGCTDIEACLYADISTTALYDYQKANPEFTERKQRLKETPVFKARSTLIKSLGNTEDAKWYLTRKRKDEFGTTVTLEGGDNPIKITVTDKAEI